MDRRGFIGATAASVATLFLPRTIGAHDGASRRIRVICVGDDDNLATSEDICEVQEAIRKHPENFPEPAPGKYITYIWEGKLPVREFTVACDPPGVAIVRVGSDDRPASIADFQDIAGVLEQVINDPDLIIITHSGFELEWLPTRTEPKVPYILASHVIKGG